VWGEEQETSLQPTTTESATLSTHIQRRDHLRGGTKETDKEKKDKDKEEVGGVIGGRARGVDMLWRKKRNTEKGVAARGRVIGTALGYTTITGEKFSETGQKKRAYTFPPLIRTELRGRSALS